MGIITKNPMTHLQNNPVLRLLSLFVADEKSILFVLGEDGWVGHRYGLPLATSVSESLSFLSDMCPASLEALPL